MNFDPRFPEEPISVFFLFVLGTPILGAMAGLFIASIVGEGYLIVGVLMTVAVTLYVVFCAGLLFSILKKVETAGQFRSFLGPLIGLGLGYLLMLMVLFQLSCD
jgi:hypothetical protein